MKLNELKKDVAMLGFENDVEDDVFVASVNRALGLLYTDRPVSKTIIVHFDAPKIAMKKEFIEHHSGEVITLPTNGKCLSFRTTGEGECSIREGSYGGSYVAFSTKNQLTKRQLRDHGTITFSGEYYYTVSNLVVFEDITSSSQLDIREYSPRKEALPTDYCNDFRAFAGPPRTADGRIVEEAELRDGRISVPYEYAGDIYLTYYRAPTKITSTAIDVTIDVSEECAPLLPILTASFLWLDDDAAKAQYYMNLYRDSIANIKRFSTVRLESNYGSNGWA